jgi:hypothetical protein
VGGGTYEIQTSAGRLDVEFGWDGWVAISGAGTTGEPYAARRLVSSPWDLAVLLASFGLTQRQAETAANRLWAAHTGTPTAEAPVSGLPLGPLEVAAGLAAAAGAVALFLIVF